MHTSTLPRAGKSALLICAGPLAVASCLALYTQDSGPSVSLPLAAISVLVTLPALYIAAALTGAAPPLGRLVSEGASALESGSIALLGLTPALLFLLATAGHNQAAVLLGRGTIAIGTVVALRSLFVRAFVPEGARAALVFVIWSLVAVGLAAHLSAQGA